MMSIKLYVIRVMGLIKAVFFYFFSLTTKLFSGRFRNRLIVFGANSGIFSGDSPWHLFLWYLNNQPNQKIVWCTANFSEYRRLRKSDLPVAYRNSPFYWFKVISAKTFFFSHGLIDVTPNFRLIPLDARVVYLTHDIAPKRTRHAVQGERVTKKMLKRSALERKIVTDYISCSPFISKCRSLALGVPVEKFRVTGLPRTDVLWQSRTKQLQKDTFMVDGLEVEKVILYAPTWRSGRYATDLLPFSESSISDLVEFLDAKKAVIVLRCHKNDLVFPEVRDKIELLVSLSDRIIDGTHSRFGDVNHFLPEVDVLVSDYSGIIHDFLLLDRPIVLVTYDRASFEQSNGFFYDYDEMAPGDVAVTGEQFLTALHLAFDSPNHHKGKRQSLCDLVFSYQDDHACERVAHLIEYGDFINEF